MSDSISSIFESRAAKFEEDLLITFSSSKDLLISDFNANLKLQFFITKFSILLISLVNYLSVCTVFLEYKSNWIYYQASLAKLNELVMSNKNFVTFFQKACITQLLYSLILKKSSSDLPFLTVPALTTNKFVELKNLTSS